MWEAIERLQQGKSLNIQDVKTNLFWEFGKFTSHEGETMESYYTRFYKLMNEMIRNNLTIATMQVNVQFLQQLQPEWSRYKGKKIAKPITPPSETASEEDSDPEQTQRDKDMQKNLALIAKYFKKIYKPTNNNLRTSSNSRNKNVDMTPRQSGIQCFNCKEFGRFAKECRKQKRVKDSAYHKEKMLLCKQAEQGVPLQAEQYDWLEDTDEEIDEQELEAHNSYMAKIQEVPTTDTCTDSEPLEHVQNDTGYNVFSNDLQPSEQSESVSNTCLVETNDSNVFPDSPNMCDDDIQNDQNDVESDDERVALANLKLDVDENKKIQKRLKKANTTLAQELKECKTILEETSKTLGESNSVRDSCLVALQNNQPEFKKYKAFNNRTIDYEKLKYQFRAPTNQDMEILIQTCLMPLAIKTQNDSFIFAHELKQEMHADLKYVESLEKEIDELESDKAKFLNMYDMILQECVSNDVMCSYLLSLSDLDVLAELQCLYLHKVKECDCLAQKLSKQTESISKEVHTGLLQRFGKVEKHFISLGIALQNVKNRDSEHLDKMKEKGDLCILVGYSNQSKEYRVYNKRTRLIVESNHIRFDEIKKVSKTSVANDTLGLAPQRQKASDYDNSDPVPQPQNVSSLADAHVSLQQELDLLFGPLYDEFFIAGSNPQGTQPAMNIQTTLAPSTPINVHAEENNDNQAEEEEQLPDDKFTNPFCVPAQEVFESSSHNIDRRENGISQWSTKEEVYVAQPNRFVDPDHLEKVYRLMKALYGLKQTPKAWYDKLSKFLTSKGFTKELQIYQSPRGIFINQAKYALEILHKHGMEKGQSIGTPMTTKPKLDEDLSGNPVDQTDYRGKIESLMYLTSSRPDTVQAIYADHAGCIDSPKSTSGGIQFLGDKLVSWMSKTHDCTTVLSAEAEYVALSTSCAQVMWMRTQLQDYGLHDNQIPLYYDSQSAIAISCNFVQHSRTKHIHTRYHFIKEQVENGIIEFYFVRTEYQLADMFTKALPEDRFKYLVRRIGMRCLTPAELEVLAKESA
nr:retrovirus-related Pol polyprotein from transposon TNT 1-94 [Tanacetum cinerariifolium]